MEIKIHKADNSNGVTIEAVIPLDNADNTEVYKSAAQKLADAMEFMPSGTIDRVLEIFNTRLEENAQSRLNDVYARIQEMDYALVAGNISHDDIPFDTLKRWVHYVITGRSISPNGDDFLSVAELDADSDGYPGGSNGAS